MPVAINEKVFQDCPIRNVLSRICDKWSMLVLYILKRNGGTPMRFNALRKQIPDISQKMLTSTLRTLEADGYVERTVYAEVPPRVEYSLTPRSFSLIPLIDNLIDWATDNMAAIMNERNGEAKHSRMNAMLRKVLFQPAAALAPIFNYGFSPFANRHGSLMLIPV